MELLFEFLVDLFFEGSIEIAKNKKVSKWIRYPLMILISIFVLGIIFLIAFVGISLAIENDKMGIYGGILFLSIDALLIFGIARKIRKVLKEKNDK